MRYKWRMMAPRGCEDATQLRRWNLNRFDIPESPLPYPIKIPLIIDARARADRDQKPGITQLAKEIVDANPNAVIIAIRGALGSFGNHRILNFLRGPMNRFQVSSAGRHAEET
jgi:hypothetical protein